MRALYGLAAAACLAAAHRSIEPANPHQDPILKYRNWAKMTPNPVPISDHLDLLCRGLTTKEKLTVATSPHRKRAITVFVNSAGAKAMASGKPFPVGSMIVKEKQEIGFGDDPKRPVMQGGGPVVLSTFMIKRESGYNPACGDWEFGVIDGPTRKIVERGKIGRCMKCHVEKQWLDFTFRSYLPGNR